LIIDMHMHIWAPDYIPEKMRYSWARLAANRRYPFRNPEDIFPKVSVNFSDPEGTYTMKEMDKAGVDVSVSMLVDYSILCEQEAEIPLIKVMENYSELQKKYENRFYAFATVDPRRPDALEIFEYAIKELGLKGLKLYPATGFYPADQRCLPLYEKCVEWNIPVVYHTSTVQAPLIQKYTHPIHISDVQALYPELNIILAHAGKGHWWEDAVTIASAHPNTYLELSMWSEVAFQNKENFIRKLAFMRDSVGAHKILFASDNCAGTATEGDRSWLHQWVKIIKELPESSKEYGIQFKQEEIAQILGENGKRLLKLP
jgi:predicted TIM-barrel fold metal-dependent hydrolase